MHETSIPIFTELYDCGTAIVNGHKVAELEVHSWSQLCSGPQVSRQGGSGGRNGAGHERNDVLSEAEGWEAEWGQRVRSLSDMH